MVCGGTSMLRMISEKVVLSTVGVMDGEGDKSMEEEEEMKEMKIEWSEDAEQR